MTIDRFKKVIWDHYGRAGRFTLPWRRTRDPYAILISEVMLQQTQVGRVEGYYKNFLHQFPDFETLSAAKTSDVLKVWQGLGYNRRALFLKKLAGIVVDHFEGALPRDRAVLETLPGIGKGTSGSIMAFAFNKPEVFIETNIRRVFIHFFFEGKKKVTDDELKRYIESSVLTEKNPREWYWALMDYGASMGGTIKISNPNRRSSHYKKQAAFKGSDRELRGKILRSVIQKKVRMDAFDGRSKKIVARLLKEGFIVKKGNYICINDHNAKKSR
jgi:A/G-specific adenine glycosylase